MFIGKNNEKKENIKYIIIIKLEGKTIKNIL